MPYELTFEDLPAGYSLSVARKGKRVVVSRRGFLSSEDGDKLITFLEGFPSQLLSRGSVPVAPSMLDHLLAVIRADKTATLYVNELEFRARVQVKRPFKKGQPVFPDDIADVKRLELSGVSVPADAGVVFVFSVGWRKGLFYDLSPLEPQTGSTRDYDLEMRLGQLYRYLQFQHVYKINEDDWKGLVDGGWFPFVTLKRSTVLEIIAHVRNAWNVDDLLPKIADEIKGVVPRLKERWASNRHFSTHYRVLHNGLERYLAGDYVSCIAVLFPKIEGILRTFSLATGEANMHPASLTNSAVRRLQTESPDSLLFPRRFRKYLNKLYFRSFDPTSPDAMSRHTLAHGVAPTDTFTQKEATLAILVLDQLAFFLADAHTRDSNE